MYAVILNERFTTKLCSGVYDSENNGLKIYPLPHMSSLSFTSKLDSARTSAQFDQSIRCLSKMGRNARKPVFGASDKASFKQVFSATETS